MSVDASRAVRLALAGCLFAAVALPPLLGIGTPVPRASQDLYLWAWQRNEDLTFIDPAATKVALWVGTTQRGQRKRHTGTTEST